jgi:hypothetical protein
MRITLGPALVIACAAVAIPLTAGAANAAPADHHPVPAPATDHHHPGSGHTSSHDSTPLTTRVRHAAIRSMASTSSESATVDTVHKKGSEVDVECWVKGETVRGDRVWYRTTAPKTGYIAGADLAIDHEPSAGVQPCTMHSSGNR